MSTRDHADKVGIVGATFAALCCLGIPAVLSIVAALGLGFLVNDAVLAPLLLLSVGIVAWGLTDGWRRHRNPSALMLGVVCGRDVRTASEACGPRARVVGRGDRGRADRVSVLHRMARVALIRRRV